MDEALNIIAASRKAERAIVDRSHLVARVVLSTLSSAQLSTVRNRTGRRTESARASSGNLH